MTNLHLVNVEMADSRVKARVQVVQHFHHLQTEFLRVSRICQDCKSVSDEPLGVQNVRT